MRNTKYMPINIININTDLKKKIKSVLSTSNELVQNSDDTNHIKIIKGGFDSKINPELLNTIYSAIYLATTHIFYVIIIILIICIIIYYIYNNDLLQYIWSINLDVDIPTINAATSKNYTAPNKTPYLEHINNKTNYKKYKYAKYKTNKSLSEILNESDDDYYFTNNQLLDLTFSGSSPSY